MLLTLISVFFVFSCATGADRISAELSPAELIQRAQEASDHSRYNTALQYYYALVERYPNNLELLCTGEYEIAFIHYKQKKYAQARSEFNALLERYNSPDAELLPQQFKRLAILVLNNITEKEKPLFKKK